jgi:hypothetical protein
MAVTIRWRSASLASFAVALVIFGTAQAVCGRSESDSFRDRLVGL